MAKFVWSYDKTVKVNMNRVDSIDIDQQEDKCHVKAYFPDGSRITLKTFPSQEEAQKFIDEITQSVEEELAKMIKQIAPMILSGMQGYGGTA